MQNVCENQASSPLRYGKMTARVTVVVVDIAREQGGNLPRGIAPRDSRGGQDGSPALEEGR